MVIRKNHWNKNNKKKRKLFKKKKKIVKKLILKFGLIRDSKKN